MVDWIELIELCSLLMLDWCSGFFLMVFMCDYDCNIVFILFGCMGRCRIDLLVVLKIVVVIVEGSRVFVFLLFCLQIVVFGFGVKMMFSCGMLFIFNIGQLIQFEFVIVFLLKFIFLYIVWFMFINVFVCICFFNCIGFIIILVFIIIVI